MHLIVGLVWFGSILSRTELELIIVFQVPLFQASRQIENLFSLLLFIFIFLANL